MWARLQSKLSTITNGKNGQWKGNKMKRIDIEFETQPILNKHQILDLFNYVKNDEENNNVA